MKVQTQELRKITTMVLDFLEHNGHKEITLTDDYYWWITKDECYIPEKEPQHLTLGQLSFDWDELQRLRQDSDDPIGYHLVWLSTILRAVGEKV